MNRIPLTAFIMLTWLSATAAIPDSTAAIKLYEQSETLYAEGNCAKADVAATKAARTFERLKMADYAASCYNVICIACQRMGNMKRAIAYGRKLYGMDMRSGVREDLSSSLNNLATLYLYDHQPRQAEKFVLKSIETEKPLKRKGRLAIRYGLACEIYTALRDYDRAERYGEAAYLLDRADSLDANAAKRLSQLAALYNVKYGGYF